MIIGARRAVLIAAIAVVVITIILYPLIVATPIDVNKVDIKLSKVELLPSSNEGAKSFNLRVTFNFTNNNPFTLTTSQVKYDLVADRVKLGSFTLSYEDVPVNGRPVLFNFTIARVVDSGVTVGYSDSIAQEYKDPEQHL